MVGMSSLNRLLRGPRRNNIPSARAVAAANMHSKIADATRRQKYREKLRAEANDAWRNYNNAKEALETAKYIAHRNDIPTYANEAYRKKNLAEYIAGVREARATAGLTNADLKSIANKAHNNASRSPANRQRNRTERAKANRRGWFWGGSRTRKNRLA